VTGGRSKQDGKITSKAHSSVWYNSLSDFYTLIYEAWERNAVELT